MSSVTRAQRSIPSWDEYFMTLVRQIATRSKDRSTQVGCVIVGPPAVRARIDAAIAKAEGRS